MYSFIRHVRLVLIAGTALALSAGLAFGATPPAASTGLANAAAHAGKTVPVAAGDQTLGEDEFAGEDESAGEDEETEIDEETETDEVEVEEVEGTEDAGDNCSVDPTVATPEELDALNHGAVVCWAAHQAEWPAWFSNHGAFVRCWAHQGKADATSCTEDPAAVEGTDESSGDLAPATHGKGHGHGQGKGKTKHQE